ncbi:hypothetical protein GC176_12705 [bacterium]|nr:hypothetical protein [bacterium]
MASSKQSTGLIVTMSLLGLWCLAATTAAYMQFRELEENKAKFKQAGDDLQKERQAAKNLDDQIQALKQRTGYPQPEVGSVEDGAANTMIGAMTADMTGVNQKYPISNMTLAATVETLLQKATSLESELNQAQTEIGTNNQAYAQRETELNAKVQEHEAARRKAEADNQELIRSKDEEVRAKQAQIEELRRTYNDLQVEFDDAKASWSSEREDLKTELNDLIVRVDDLRQKLKDVTAVSFEKPDGYVRWVDTTARTVSISLGSQDGLRERTTFSVYRRNHHGVARKGSEEIKAQIEVVRIRDAHSAEARILDDDIYDPISKGDPIYTPLWSPGMEEVFAVVGRVDLDRDGIEDREQFHDLVSDAGARLNHEVLDNGVRVRYLDFPSKFVEWSDGDPILDSNTKYLIIADIPDPALAVLDDEREQRTLISSQLSAMRAEARRLGIEEINLGAFLSYAGYVPQRRIYIPGLTERRFPLKAGAASVTTDEVIGDRSAAGSVSGVFGRSKRLKAETSSDQTSGLYRSGGGN